MNRRRFLRDAAQAGMGLGVGESLLGKGGATPSAAAAKAGQVAGKPAPKGKAKPLAIGTVGTPVVSLDGQWLIAADARNVGGTERWYARSFPEAKSVTVPGIIQEALPAYHGVVWYAREFVPPAHPHKDGRYLLRFWAVDYLADVWVNGVHLGGHEGGETPFVLDATKAIKPGESSRVVVRVLNPSNERIDGIVLAETPHRNKVIPYSNGSSYDYGGILESVELLLAPAVRVEDVFVRPDPKTGKIRIQVKIQNTTGTATRGSLQFTAAPAATGETLATTQLERELAAGESVAEAETRLENPRLWDLADPFLYRVTVRLQTEHSAAADETAVRCGFREFCVEKGYFRLNGKRVFVRSTHTGNHVPIGQVVPVDQARDLQRRDMLYAKASGFNTVRFISGMAHPANLDLCDELGLMVYEESLAGWVLGDSPKMKERYDFSIREMVLRDRNHPSVVMWGMLNETRDGPVFREAVAALKLVRSLDDSRLVLLSSGRWDGQLSIGSVSNPCSSDWEHVWGKEAVGAGVEPMTKIGGQVKDVGDVHFYPQVPQAPEVNRLLRTMGEDAKPVFLSEYGIGSMMDVIHEARAYEQVSAAPDLEDFVLMRSMAERLIGDWNRWRMDGVYAFPEDLLRDSQQRMARHRLLGFDLIRSNPKICGFNLTGMLDHGMTGEGVWRFWRDWKPGAMDTMQDGWWPLRWCLFVEPTHSYAGRAFQVEAVLANEDVLGPGEYPARFRICGPSGVTWERSASVQVPQPPPGEDGPLAVPALNEEVTLGGLAGSYQFVANLERGGAPLGRAREFYLSDAGSLPRLNQVVTVWGIEGNVESWLKAHGVACERFGGTAPSRREIILVGDVSKAGADADAWKELARRMARGSLVVFLSPFAFQREKDAMAWLPLAQKGRCYKFGDWLYHKECVAKAHPIFAGLPSKGILDWYYYGPVLPRYLFDGQETPDEVVAAAFATGYPAPDGYASGILLGSYRFGEGRFVVNTFPTLENVDTHPAADRLLLNLIDYATAFVVKPLAELPADFDAQLRAIGYVQ